MEHQSLRKAPTSKSDEVVMPCRKSGQTSIVPCGFLPATAGLRANSLSPELRRLRSCA